ncbi:MAG: NPCBM/NEW2 domain-containing protein [Syntrophobacterales bacterium]|nr:NPCBM/NEW2 domain-containing protein [Syntrophobacterales bacterium]
MSRRFFPLFLVFSVIFLWPASFAAAKEIFLERLEPLDARVYEMMKDADSGADREGLVVTPWQQMGDRDAGEKRYKSGLKFTIVSSWSVARLAVDYNLEGGGYQTFTGKIVPHESARNSRTTYTVRIVGDGKVLYISNMITSRTPPQPFSLDVSSVKKMVIEARGNGNDNRFYTNSYFGIVDAVLTRNDDDCAGVDSSLAK